MKTLYVIHGWTYTTKPWERTILFLKQKGIKVEMLNVPGLTAPSNKVWTIEDYVKWADKNLPKDATVVGHSNGGRILLNLLSENPNRVKHLILVDAAGVYEESKKRNISRKVSKAFSPLKKVKIFRKVYHKLLGASDYDRAPENMKKTLSNMLDSDKKLDISKVTTPTTILWGKKDTVTPPHQGEKMKELLPNASLTMYANWSHAPYISDPQGFARALYKTLVEEEKMLAEVSKKNTEKEATAKVENQEKKAE